MVARVPTMRTHAHGKLLERSNNRCTDDVFLLLMIDIRGVLDARYDY